MITIGEFIAFEGVGVASIAFILAAHFLGFYIRGLLGFGSNLPIVLLTIWVLGPHQAILLVALTSGLAQVHLLPQGFRRTDWSIARRLAIGMMAGIGLGVWVFAGIDADWLVMLLSALIIGILLMDRFRIIEHLQSYIDLRSSILVTMLATISGAVGTVSGGGGLYFLVVYLKLVCATPEILRSTNVFLAGTFLLFRLILLTFAGMFTPELLAEAFIVAPAVFLGSWAGTRLFQASSPERFYSILQLVLLAAAVALFVKGILFLVI
ncbi:MAG: hypothetical protein CMP14_03230 [Rickettsiales bacterium]|nr:hypothetical protein [Rickettsiales bacterium]